MQKFLEKQKKNQAIRYSDGLWGSGVRAGRIGAVEGDLFFDERLHFHTSVQTSYLKYIEVCQGLQGRGGNFVCLHKEEVKKGS